MARDARPCPDSNGAISYAESHMKKMLLAFVAFGLLAAQEKVDQASAARFRSEELEKSQIMQTLHMLTDRYGPRVTGSPNHEAAANWVVKQLTDWGLKNAHLRSEEHTSELQSLRHLVCRLLLEKKK